MALLELALDVLFDPDFNSSFNIIRRVETIGQNGRVSYSQQVIPASGVVTSTGQNTLHRREDYQIGMRGISIVCSMPLLTNTTGKTADVVEWLGSQYLVEHCDLYPQFGTGWYQVEAISMTTIDPEPVYP